MSLHDKNNAITP